MHHEHIYLDNENLFKKITWALDNINTIRNSKIGIILAIVFGISLFLMKGGKITSDVTILGSVTANTILTPAEIGGTSATIANASSSIDAGGFAKFMSASIGGWTVNTNAIFKLDLLIKY